MKSDFYRNEKIHHIYIIYNTTEESAYIGKTYSDNPRARLRAHLRGECELTADDFGPEAPNPGAIKFQLLESVVCTGSDAYRHVVAWCYFFEERGMLLLNAAGTSRDTEHLHPKTKAIYDTVCAPFSVEEVLAREVEPLKRPPNSKGHAPAYHNLNILVPAETAETFQEFCAQQNLMQKDALRYLLLAQENLSSQKLIASIQREFSEKDAQIDDLKATIAEKQARIQRAKDRNRVVIATCQQYVDDIVLSLPNFVYPSIKPMSFNTAKFKLDFSAYAYPESSGCDYFYLEHLVYGRGPAAALFLLGFKSNGKKIKLRWYDKDTYVGRYFPRSPYAHENSPWLVGYTAAADGAVDLVIAIPLEPLEPFDEAEILSDSPSALHPSIDELIAAAAKKSK